MLHLCSFDLRSPEAMRAATKEVQSVLESAEESVSLNGKHISLNRKQLDNMPILGMTILCRIVYAEITLPFSCSSIYYYINACYGIPMELAKKQ